MARNNTSKKTSTKSKRTTSSYNSGFQKNNGSFSFFACFFVLLVILGVYFSFNSIKRKLTPKSQKAPQTVYVSAEKKKASLKADSKKAITTAKSEAAASKTKKKNENIKNTKKAVPAKQSVNGFASAASEWQPINSAFVSATNKYKNLVFGGIPNTKHSVNILQNEPYFSAYSEEKRNPLWVAYRLDAGKTESRYPRPSGFATDSRTKSKIDQKVYTRSGYDRGHLCPNAAIARRYGKKGQRETFLMSNICPQKPNLNRKIWEHLERLEEAYANKFNGIYVFTGPIFDSHVEILNKKVEIPDAFFKILIDEEKGKIRVLPFIIPQNVTGKEILNDFLTSIDEIESKTGLDFFSAMDDQHEKLLESYNPSKTMWK